MKIICCYRSMEERSAIALAKYAPETEMINTSSSIYDYPNAVAERWTGEEDLVVIEEDKEITAEVIPAFKGCNHLWCSFDYHIYPPEFRRYVKIGLGCARYSAEIQRMVDPSEFMDSRDDPGWGWCSQCKGAGCWMHLDARIARAIRSKKDEFDWPIDVVVHGRVEHHHDYTGVYIIDKNGVYTDNSFLVASILMQRAQEGIEGGCLIQQQYPNDELAGPAWKTDKS